MLARRSPPAASGCATPPCWSGSSRQARRSRSPWLAPSGSETVIADAVLINDGFQPRQRDPAASGLRMEWDARFAQLRPVRSAECATSVAGDLRGRRLLRAGWRAGGRGGGPDRRCGGCAAARLSLPRPTRRAARPWPAPGRSRTRSGVSTPIGPTTSRRCRPRPSSAAARRSPRASSTRRSPPSPATSARSSGRRASAWAVARAATAGRRWSASWPSGGAADRRPRLLRAAGTGQAGPDRRRPGGH